MNDSTPIDQSAPTSTPVEVRSTRGKKITIAALVTAGLATGGVYAATGSFASGGSSAPSGSASAGTNAAPKAPVAPSANDLDGVVTASSSSSLTVRNDFGTSRTFAVTDDTTVHQGRTKSSAGSIETGQRVHVRATKSGSTYTAKDVDIRAAHIDGVVKSVSGDSVTVTDHDGFTRSIALSSGTTVTKDGKSADRDDLKAGVVVRAEGAVASDGTTLDATAVDILTKAPTPPAGGPAGAPGRPGGKGGPGAPPANGKSGAPKAPSGAPKAPSGAPKAPSTAPSGGASSGS